MSVSTEVQRTLVKSPPELWSELSNPEVLARHLSELGEIRITAVEPETKVEWKSEDASGVVQLKQSGWGTKVTLTVTRTPPVPVDMSEPEPPESEPVATESDPEPVAVESESQPDAVIAAQPDVETDPEPEVVAVAEPEPRLGFFARLFRKRRAQPVATVEHEVEPVASVEPDVETEPEPEVVAMALPEPSYPERPPDPAVDLAAELASVEEQMAQETTELLKGVLDRLGAAHHRPFSRG
jgi:hypothetical protein